MYGWIWRHLPGNAGVRALISIVLVLAIVYVLFQYVFPGRSRCFRSTM